jgi:hypothetical protein
VHAGASEDPYRRGLSDQRVLAIEIVVELQALYRKEKGEDWINKTFEPVQNAGGEGLGVVSDAKTFRPPVSQTVSAPLEGR